MLYPLSYGGERRIVPMPAPERVCTGPPPAVVPSRAARPQNILLTDSTMPPSPKARVRPARLVKSNLVSVS
jgi:hypothetical protein